jgi:hypothetical protein
MKTLKNIKNHGEVIINFTTTANNWSSQLLVEEDLEMSKADISKIFEDNLTAMLDNGFSNESIYANTGMYIPTEEELKELEEFGEFFHVDKGYVIKGLLLMIGGVCR